MTTTNMSLNEPSVGSTSGPTWASETNDNWTSIDQHDHTSGKGVQLTPSGLNINADLEFNGNAATELKRLTIDSSATGSGTSYSVYQSGGNLYWYNGSGQAVQITNGTNVKTTGGSIDGMDSTDAGADYGSGYFKWEFDTTKTPFAGAKMKNADIELHKYDGSSGSDAYIILKYTGSSEGSNNLTFPDETGTVLSTATSFAGAISIANTSGAITIDAETDLNLDANGGNFYFKDGGTAIGKISNSSSDLVIENEVDAKDIIFQQFDGSEVVRMADDRRLYFYDKGGEYIYGDGTDLYLVSGADINIPSDIGLTFGNDGEKIEGNGTKLDIAAAELDFSIEAGGDINIGTDIGLTFGADGEKIEGDGTDLTVSSSGNFTVDVDGDIILDADGADIKLKDGGVQFGTLKQVSNHLVIQPESSKEIIFNDGSGTASLSVDAANQNVSINNGNLVMGSAGAGIDFSGAQTAAGGTTDEVLSGYEEGSFTLTVECASPGDNWPASSSRDTDKDTGFAVYTKIGNVCTVSTYFHAINLTDGGGALSFTGLPFNGAAQISLGGGFASHQGITWNTSAHVVVRKGSGDDELSLYQSIAGGNWSGLDCPAVASTYIEITITYLTA